MKPCDPFAATKAYLLLLATLVLGNLVAETCQLFQILNCPYRCKYVGVEDIHVVFELLESILLLGHLLL